MPVLSSPGGPGHPPIPPAALVPLLVAVLAGLRRPTAGQVLLAMPQDRVAYAPDAPEFEPWLTAAEVVDVAAGLLGRPRDRGAVANMLERVGLAGAARRRVGGFSRGMRSRLGLAAALIGGPHLLLADEPAAALDPGGRLEILELLAGLADEPADQAGPVTVVVSSHDLGHVERICGRIGVMASGRPGRLVLPRYLVLTATVIVALAAGTLAAWYETTVLLGPVPAAGLAAGFALEALWFCFVTGLVVAFASVVRSAGAAVILVAAAVWRLGRREL
jgi:ABC-type cobalamin/Fe3+-siderophores transport system ATPase subunit